MRPGTLSNYHFTILLLSYGHGPVFVRTEASLGTSLSCSLIPVRVHFMQLIRAHFKSYARKGKKRKKKKNKL